VSTAASPSPSVTVPADRSSRHQASSSAHAGADTKSMTDSFARAPWVLANSPSASAPTRDSPARTRPSTASAQSGSATDAWPGSSAAGRWSFFRARRSAGLAPVPHCSLTRM